jgi:lysophospholipase L1-like esterase
LLALLITVASIAGLAGPARAATLTLPATVHVMPLGDSITYGIGSSTTSSYRAELWRRLAEGGYGVRFVGSVASGQLADTANEGHSGWTISQVTASVGGWLSTYSPTAVLLHIGTNDVKAAATATGAPARLSALIDKIRVTVPSATIFVAQIVPGGEAAINARVVTFNNAIPGIVASKDTSKVKLVDTYHALTQSDLADSLHPNDSGYVKMAGAWYSAMTQVLPRGGLIASALNAARCIDTGSPSSGSPVQLWSCHGGGAQRWSRNGEALRTMGKCLDLSGGSTANGARVALVACNSAASQHWQLRADGSVYNPTANRCVDVPFSDPALGARLIIWNCQGGPNQTWLAG